MSALEDIAAATERRLLECLATADPAGRALPADASAAAREALTVAAALQRPLDQARAGAWLCTHLLRLGQHQDVLREAPTRLLMLAMPAAAAALGAERRELMRVLTLSACETGDFDIALDTAHELVRLTATLGEDGASLNAAFALAVCFERMGDSWQAMRVLSRALELHGGAAPELPLLITLNALCAIAVGLYHHLHGGDEDEAQEMLQRALGSAQQALLVLERLHDPVYDVAVCGNLGEVLVHQGDLPGAEALLQRAMAGAQARGLTAYRWRLRTSMGDAQLARGRAETVIEDMTGLLAEMGERAPQQTAIRAHHTAYRACRVLGRFEQALVHFEAVEQLSRRRATSQLRAQSRLFVTRTEAQQAQWQAEQARLDAQAQRERAAEFAARAERDPLTGLGNRRHFDRRCSELMPVLQREQRPVALALIDVDHFKTINDRHGHAGGDAVLVELARLLRESTRTRDVLARYGGEEFVIVLPGMGLAPATELCERLRDGVARHAAFQAAGAALQVTISLGLAVAPGYDVPQLLQRADIALYRAKREGRNRVCAAAAA